MVWGLLALLLQLTQLLNLKPPPPPPLTPQLALHHPAARQYLTAPPSRRPTFQVRRRPTRPSCPPRHCPAVRLAAAASILGQADPRRFTVLRSICEHLVAAARSRVGLGSRAAQNCASRSRSTPRRRQRTQRTRSYFPAQTAPPRWRNSSPVRRPRMSTARAAPSRPRAFRTWRLCLELRPPAPPSPSGGVVAVPATATIAAGGAGGADASAGATACAAAACAASEYCCCYY
jgi:hypothetical protein